MTDTNTNETITNVSPNFSMKGFQFGKAWQAVKNPLKVAGSSFAGLVAFLVYPGDPVQSAVLGTTVFSTFLVGFNALDYYFSEVDNGNANN